MDGVDLTRAADFMEKFEEAFDAQDQRALQYCIRNYCEDQTRLLRGVCFSEDLSGVYSSVMYLHPPGTYPDFQSFLSSVQEFKDAILKN